MCHVQMYARVKKLACFFFPQKHRPEGKIEYDIYIIMEGFIGIFPAIGVWSIEVEKFHYIAY